ncbi:M61 family peptidase [Lacihabitans sp. LS3-19]|uniref:M61 family metallopeptidase n=1 Tax=Lacihabitans sp. LS3-19 TaxID=2487335 RepID=UPI0020CD12E7|nr:PDZ domain-containing protein [Lacihabitans sp. LS3-19]MCP9768201.1 M61 family peptidase [Lacihabitans sp. LS3-19]
MKSTNRAILLLLLILGFNSCTVANVKRQMENQVLSYELSMPQPTTHYFEVKMKLDLNQTKEISENYVDFKMAAWTPGSYLIREYAKNVEGFSAKSENGALELQKVSKNTWRVFTKGNQHIEVNYRVYAYELTVRTSHLDDSHGYANGACVFMFVPQLMKTKSILKVIPHETFEKVSVALPEIAKNTFEVEDFDTLVDSPIEIGNQDIIEFETMGVKHTIANYSLQKLNYDKKELVADYKKVVEASASVIGGPHPCKNYLFIVHHLPGIGGGLEHLNSTTCQTSPQAYDSRDRYIGFLGLIAHEYFHLWNVKRLRPVALGPFDYENENYTNMLWVSEGFTSFYQNDILRRAGLIDETKMFSQIAYGIASIENSFGNKVQSVTESSWDAWIKYYRPNENSNNSTVSYYTKGGVLANVLNMIIIGETKGEKSLDDVLRLLYKEKYLASNVGFSDAEFKSACEQIAGKDLSELFENKIYGTQTLDYAQYFNNVDADITIEPSTPNTPWVGITVRNKIVTRVDRGSGAYDFGINVNDEILKVDGKTFYEIEDFTKNKEVGKTIKVEVKRSGVIKEYNIPLRENPTQRVSIRSRKSDDPLAIKKYSKWMHL